MLENILLVVSILLIAIVLLQSNRADGASQIISGGIELLISRITLALGIVFFIISFVLFIK